MLCSFLLHDICCIVYLNYLWCLDHDLSMLYYTCTRTLYRCVLLNTNHTKQHADCIIRVSGFEEYIVGPRVYVYIHERVCAVLGYAISQFLYENSTPKNNQEQQTYYLDTFQPKQPDHVCRAIQIRDTAT